jgi:hypothetical protein
MCEVRVIKLTDEFDWQLEPVLEPEGRRRSKANAAALRRNRARCGYVGRLPFYISIYFSYINSPYKIERDEVE